MFYIISLLSDLKNADLVLVIYNESHSLTFYRPCDSGYTSDDSNIFSLRFCIHATTVTDVSLLPASRQIPPHHARSFILRKYIR